MWCQRSFSVFLICQVEVSCRWFRCNNYFVAWLGLLPLQVSGFIAMYCGTACLAHSASIRSQLSSFSKVRTSVQHHWHSLLSHLSKACFSKVKFQKHVLLRLKLIWVTDIANGKHQNNYLLTSFEFLLPMRDRALLNKCSIHTMSVSSSIVHNLCWHAWNLCRWLWL